MSAQREHIASSSTETKQLAKLRARVLEELDQLPGYRNPCLSTAERALQLSPGNPFFLWATLTQLDQFLLDRRHAKFIAPPRWISQREGAKKLRQRMAESLAVLASPDDGSSDRRMLFRLVNLFEGIRKVESHPDDTGLAEAKAHCDAYERTRDDDFEPFEADFGPGTFFRQLRARVRAWEVVAKVDRTAKDFLFVPELVAVDDGVLKWALDPVVALADFQEWAFEEIAERKVTTPVLAPRLGSFFSSQLKYDATAPPSRMRAILVGRLLAVLLVGASDTDAAAADAVASGFSWAIEALVRAGVDTRSKHGDDDAGLRLSRGGARACAASLMRATADRY